ncbi:TPA: hypothetical protein HH149_003476 [Escherichia coli]|nr:hypothetical protein [Escherichia coli]HAH4966107.1 hypothetical protein [Escherichia coli]
MADNPLPAKRYLPAPGLRQFAASQKKANDYPAIIAAFSTEVCCFFLFYCLDDEKPGN